MTGLFFKQDLSNYYHASYKAHRLYTSPNLLTIWRGSPDRIIGEVCERGNLRCAEILLAHGSLAVNFGLWSASKGGHADVACLMIRHGATEINWALTGASEAGHHHIIDLLASQGATEWNYALFWACRNGQTESANTLIQNGADYCTNCLGKKHNQLRR